MQDVHNPPYRAEVARKIFHFTNLAIPIIYFFIPKTLALTILVPLTLAFITVDILRFYNTTIGTLFYRFFGFLLRSKERDENNKRLNGATYVLISATICIIIFPKIFAVTGLITLTFADSAAALVGRRIGKRKFFQKSLEGSIAFFFTALVVILSVPKLALPDIEYVLFSYLIAIVAAATGMVAEAVSGVVIDDNIAIPVSVASILWLGYTVLLPHVDLYTSMVR
jgi:dolichol kinase